MHWQDNIAWPRGQRSSHRQPMGLIRPLLPRPARWECLVVVYGGFFAFAVPQRRDPRHGTRRRPFARGKVAV